MSTATTATTATTGATMSQLRNHAQLSKFFTRNAGDDAKAAKKGKKGHEAALSNWAVSMTGAALLRAHSGNEGGQLMAVEANISAWPKVEKTPAEAALMVAREGKPRHMAGASIETFVTFANETHSRILGALAPAPVAPKAKPAPINWKDRAERAEAAHAALLVHVATLSSMLGDSAPAMPVGATLAPANVTEDAPM